MVFSRFTPESIQRKKGNPLKTPTNIVIAALLTLIVVMLYQLNHQEQEVSSDLRNQMVNMNGTLGLYNQNGVATGSSPDGFWLYKEEERQVYFFRYDKETDKIVQIKKNITQP